MLGALRYVRERRRERMNFYSQLTMGRQRVLRDHSHPLDVFDEPQLLERFRFGRDGIMFLVDTLRADIEPRRKHPNAVPPELKVFATLQFLATGNFIGTSGDVVGVSKATASRCIRQVVEALARRSKHFIRWPTENERTLVEEAFFLMDGFPGVVGCIDGTHVKILAPSQHEDKYINRKFYHSINVQLVVDSSSIIRNVVAKWAGSVHDARVLSRSGVARKFESGCYQGLLLGDSAYPCRPWLMTPFRAPAGPQQMAYNVAHGSTRAVVERTIGQLKRRFHCLHGELRVSPLRCCNVIVACCVLHNIAKGYSCEEPVARVPLDDVSVYDATSGQDGARARLDLVARFFS